MKQAILDDAVIVATLSLAVVSVIALWVFLS
jgi:hypothetical protein